MQFSFITINLWRLREMHRVAPLVTALQRIGRDLEPGAEGGPLPDVIAFQELESRAPLDRLGEALAGHHVVQSCVCARQPSGESRSVVAIAARRSRFDVVGHECIGLGRLWPDHGRCSLALRLRPVGSDLTLDVVDVHLSARPLNGRQGLQLSEELRRRRLLDAQRLIIAGDLNCSRRATGYRRLAAPPLRDAFAADQAPTHWFGRRIDHVLIGPGVSLVRSLSTAVVKDAVRPAHLDYRWWRHRSVTAPSITDHSPLGGLFDLIPS